MADNQNISNENILLHACCGICSGYPISLLQEMNYNVTVYFYNPNIFPQEEYYKRLEAQKTICGNFDCNLITGEYEPEIYFEYVKGLETEPEKGRRCDKCFELRLEQAAQKTKELGFDKFTTSLVISPHKDYEKISAIGTKIAQKYNLEYIPINFRKNDGFLKTNKISKNLNIYRQNYCGCKFSINFS